MPSGRTFFSSIAVCVYLLAYIPSHRGVYVDVCIPSHRLIISARRQLRRNTYLALRGNELGIPSPAPIMIK
ncbi:hypothetical protein B0H17DRAFT_1085852 [Mycena rosella]|uniref:Secreted protein n=1 Tax=Mycena rosella TaxID=1033263 RepID=A0AAD7CYR4_MYCRO|nr:hypothetical protein B0H17DRAFT_1085852 [Mycena rosella]